jgi:hypothetical protein
LANNTKVALYNKILLLIEVDIKKLALHQLLLNTLGLLKPVTSQ